MNRIEIIAVGNEILSGRVLDSNSNWLAKELTALGGDVVRFAVVRDITDEIVREVQSALANKARVIITTGGLGPTFDDKTLEAVAQALNRALVLHAGALERITQKYEDLKKKCYVGTMKN